MIKISPSILAAKDRIESIKKLNNTNAEYFYWLGRCYYEIKNI